MNFVTIKTMTSSKNKFHGHLVAIIAALLTIGLAGCDDAPEEPYRFPGDNKGAGGSLQTGAGGTHQGGNTQQDGGPSGGAQEDAEVSYDIPDGWKKTGRDALYEHPAKDGKIPFAKLAFSSFRSGTDADAKSLVHAYYQQEIDECKLPLCNTAELASEFKTVHLDAGDIFVYITPGIYSEATRSNLFAFARNGIVFEFVLYGDTVETYTGLIGQVMTSVKITGN